MQILLLQASGLSVIGSPAFILTVVGLQGKVEFKINFTEGNKAEFVTTGTIHTLTMHPEQSQYGGEHTVLFDDNCN